MEKIIVWDLPRRDGRRPTEQIEASLLPFPGWADRYSCEGSEFLDDAIRMHDQAFVAILDADEYE